MEHQLRPVEGWGAPQALETGGFVEKPPVLDVSDVWGSFRLNQP